MTNDDVLAPMIAAVSRLAEDSDAQRRYLAQLGVKGQADELALEFDDAYRPARPRLAEQADGPETMSACDELDSALDDDSLSWDPADLDDQRWRAIRALAARVLNSLET